MKSCFAVYYRELLIMRSKIFKQVASMSVTPFLYFIAFGIGMGQNVVIEGHPYMEFLVPGLIAMSSMTQAFAIGTEINIARFYWHIFDEFQSAPITNIAYVTGELFAGITRAMLSTIIILCISRAFGIALSYNIFFWIGILLNSFVFASLAICSAMIVKSHADQSLLTNFLITPMSFLGGTFFPIKQLPQWAGQLLTDVTHIIFEVA